MEGIQLLLKNWRIFLVALGICLYVSCQSNSEPLPDSSTATATSTPTPPTPVSTSTPIPTSTPVPTSTPQPTFTPTSFPTATATDDGKVFLGDLLLLDTEVDTPGCFGVGEISYSPTSEHFLVVVACFEGDNDAFLFRSDGSDKRQITGEWDYLNYFNYEWSSDGKSFVYQRINSCCADIPPDVPPAGYIRYDIQTGEKTLLSPSTSTSILYHVANVQSDDVLNVRSGPGVNNPLTGTIPPNGTDIQITGEGVQVGNSLWVPIQYQDITGWVNKNFLVEQ